MADATERSKSVRIGLVLLVLAAGLLFVTAEPAYLGRKLFGLWTTRWMLIAVGLGLVAFVMFLRAISRDAAISATITIVLIGFVWVLAEGAGHVGVISYQDMFRGRLDGPALGTVPAPNTHVSGETYMDTATGWGFGSDPIPFDYQTNAAGFRNVPDRTDADVYLLGDSILVSALTKFEDTLTARVETLTGKRTMTVALIGISPLSEHIIFRQGKFPVDGRLVLQFIFEGNDLRDTATERAARESKAKTGPSFRERSLTQQVILLLQRLTQPVVASAPRRTCTIDDQRYTFFWVRDSFAGHEGEMKSIAAGILDFKKEIEAAGGRYAMVFVPSKLRVLREACTFPADTDFDPIEDHLSPLPEMVRALAETNGIPLLDLTAPLVAQTKKRPVPWFWGDTHPNSEGHRVMAEAVAGWSVMTSTAAP